MLGGSSCEIMHWPIPILLAIFLQGIGQIELQQHKLHAAAIWKRYKSGAVQFVNPVRDKPQIQETSRTGQFGQVVVSLRLLQTLDRLSARSTPRNPLVITSLYRTNSKAHRSGIAADIAEFSGSRIDSGVTGRGLPAVLAIVKALGPGGYLLGFSKPPYRDPIPLLPPTNRIS